MSMALTDTATTGIRADCDCDCHQENQHCERCCLDPDTGFCEDCAYYLELSRHSHTVRGGDRR